MHLYSNNLSTIAMISSSIMSEKLPACSSCINNFNWLNNSLGSEVKIIVFEIPEAEILKPDDFSNFKRVLSRLDLLP